VARVARRGGCRGRVGLAAPSPPPDKPIRHAAARGVNM
jgi:hypothetical protein